MSTSKKKVKKPTTAQLKKKLDMFFSRFVRLRDSDAEGYGNCFTCNKRFHWKEAHCGHWIPRNILATRFDEDNCRFQCVGCNLYGNGKFVDFRINLVKEIGEERVKALEAKKFTIFKVSSLWYEDKIEIYKDKVEKLSTTTS